MASNDPGHSDSPSADRLDETVRRLEARLDAASEAAERLLADAADRATRRPPPAGWQQPRPDEDGAGWFGTETDVLVGLVGALRDRIPPELQQRIADAVREVLLALRALIDWYLERPGRGASEATEVTDIPIL